MKVTHAVLGEHGVIYALLDHLEAAVDDAEELASLRDWSSLLATVLESHARLEDALLLEPLQADESRAGGPPDAMIEEHEKIRDMLAETQEEDELARVRELLLYVIRTARQHFEKEERIVIPMADQELEADALEELGDRWLDDRGVRHF